MKVLILPGYLGGKRWCAGLTKSLEANGFEVHVASVHWLKRNYFKYPFSPMSQWLENAKSEYQKLDPNETIIIGYSYGCILAMALAASRNPARLLLCSITNNFSEDITSHRADWHLPWEVADFKKFSFNVLASNISCPVQILYGDGEDAGSSNFMQRTHGAEAVFGQSAKKVVNVPKHYEGFKRLSYQREVIKVIGR